MKKIGLILLLAVLVVPFYAQTIKSPTYSRSDCKSIKILEIDRTPDYTIVKGVYTNDRNYGWVNINENTCLVDNETGNKYKIIKSDGIPISPNRYNFTKGGESINFSFFFSPVNDEVDLIDLIEDSKSTSAFNFYNIALKENIQRDFSVKKNEGQLLSHKPSLMNRLNGVEEVLIFIPRNSTNMDDFIFYYFKKYLQELGLRFKTFSASFENNYETNGPINSVYRKLDWKSVKIEDLNIDANTLAVFVSYDYSYGEYVSRYFLVVDFLDIANNYTWRVPINNMPTKGEKLIKTFKKQITNSYYYNSAYSFIPPHITSTWNESILRDYINKKEFDSLEGIYKGDKYTLGVKKGKDGIYYIMYIDGSRNIKDWHEGDIKATLTQTASPIIFKANWFGALKQVTNLTVTFSNIGFIATDTSGENDTYIKIYPNSELIEEITKEQTISSGTGFLLAKDGYIITNNHVIENAQNGNIKVTGLNEDYNKKYEVEVVVVDKQNDLAILKVSDPSFVSFNHIPYTFKFNTSNIGENCFVLGFPLISSMGKDIKLTNGIISSKTGYEGNVAQYQISAPVQPGNSGGPLFDKDGNIIGVVQAKHSLAENVGYAIKASYIKNLIDLLPTPITLPERNILKGKTLPQQVEIASKAVCIIIVNGE